MIRLHIPAIPYTITRDEYSHDAFTGKVKRFAPMMRSRGFEVYHYGVETSESDADKEIQLLTKAEWHDLRVDATQFLDKSLTRAEAEARLADPKTVIGSLANWSTPLFAEFNRRFRVRLQENYRSTATDIVCVPLGQSYDAALDGLNVTAVETGIGYSGSCKPFRIFESYSWMSYTLAAQQKAPHNYWFVIPHGFDVSEFRFNPSPKSRPQIGFLGRIIPDKGCIIIAELAKRFPAVDFVMCGQGDATPFLTSPNISYKSPIHGAERSAFLGSCAATLCPTMYLEPFGCSAVESQLCGTPVICTDNGGYVETVEQMRTGLRCHTLADYCKGVQMALDGDFDRAYVRERAARLYDMYGLAAQYEYAFRSVLDMYRSEKNGWYSPDCHLPDTKAEVDMIYYINLDRRTDRNAHMLKQFAGAGIPANKIRRITAIDGTTHTFSEAELDLFKSANFSMADASTTAKIMGNQLSHLSVYRDMIANRYSKVLVLQDDVVFRDGFLDDFTHVCAAVPSDCEVLNIGLHEYAAYSKFVQYDLKRTTEYMGVERERVNNYVCKWKNTVNPCSLAYILTRKGATNIIAHFEKNGFPYETDHSLNLYLTQKDIFYGSRKILCTGDPSFGSDIFN